MEPVLHAMMVMISVTEFAPFQPRTLNLVMLDVPLGIGKDKLVFSAQITGCSTVKEFVFQFLINVLALTLLEPA